MQAEQLKKPKFLGFETVIIQKVYELTIGLTDHGKGMIMKVVFETPLIVYYAILHEGNMKHGNETLTKLETQ